MNQRNFRAIQFVMFWIAMVWLMLALGMLLQNHDPSFSIYSWPLAILEFLLLWQPLRARKLSTEKEAATMGAFAFFATAYCITVRKEVSIQETSLGVALGLLALVAVMVCALRGFTRDPLARSVTLRRRI